MKYKHHYTAYCKDLIIYADFEAINRNLIGQAFTEVEEFNFSENKNVTVHEIVSAQYIVIVNDSKFNFREDHPMFGKTFLFKGSNQKAVLREFIKSIRETCDTLNKEMETQYNIDEKIPYKELIKLKKQTHCFVCRGRFMEGKNGKHLHHDHKQEKGNIIASACNRCNMQMTEKRRAGVPVIFHNGSGYDWRFLMKELGSIIEEEEKFSQIEDLTKKLSLENIDVLGLNSENYITFKWNNMWFIEL